MKILLLSTLVILCNLSGGAMGTIDPAQTPGIAGTSLACRCCVTTQVADYCRECVGPSCSCGFDPLGLPYCQNHW